MLTSLRFQIALTAFVLVAFSGAAFAQSHLDVSCRKTETQPECFARLKCKADEELEQCQKRLLKCKPDEKLADCQKRAAAGDQNQNQNNSGQQDPNRGREGDDNRRDNDRDRDGDRDNNRDNDRGDDQRERERERADRDRGRDRDDGGRSNRSRGRRGRSGGGSHGFEANKTFGLGLELGEPSGLNGKYFFSASTALDFGVGWIYDHYYYGDGLHLYADVLFHPITLASTSSFELPFYIGPGLRFWDFHYCYQGLCDYGGSAIGIRVPFGIDFDFNNAPLDIFLQATPVLDFVNGDYYNRYRDRAHFGIDASVGIRFWFK